MNRERRLSEHLTALRAGDAPDVAPPWAALRAAVSARLRRWGLWERSPALLGVDGYSSWARHDRASTEAARAIDGLVADVYRQLFVLRAGALYRRLELAGEIESWTRIGLERLLELQHERHDTHGVAAFRALVPPTETLLASGGLRIASSGPHLHANTVLVFGSRGPAQITTAPVVAEAVAAWPSDWMSVGEDVRPLSERLASLRESGVEAFRLHDVIAALRNGAGAPTTPIDPPALEVMQSAALEEARVAAESAQESLSTRDASPRPGWLCTLPQGPACEWLVVSVQKRQKTADIVALDVFGVDSEHSIDSLPFEVRTLRGISINVSWDELYAGRRAKDLAPAKQVKAIASPREPQPEEEPAPTYEEKRWHTRLEEAAHALAGSAKAKPAPKKRRSTPRKRKGQPGVAPVEGSSATDGLPQAETIEEPLHSTDLHSESASRGRLLFGLAGLIVGTLLGVALGALLFGG